MNDRERCVLAIISSLVAGLAIGMLLFTPLDSDSIFYGIILGYEIFAIPYWLFRIGAKD